VSLGNEPLTLDRPALRELLAEPDDSTPEALRDGSGGDDGGRSSGGPADGPACDAEEERDGTAAMRGGEEWPALVVLGGKAGGRSPDGVLDRLAAGGLDKPMLQSLETTRCAFSTTRLPLFWGNFHFTIEGLLDTTEAACLPMDCGISPPVMAQWCKPILVDFDTGIPVWGPAVPACRSQGSTRPARPPRPADELSALNRRQPS